MTKPKILAFAGSARKDSFNKKLINVAATEARNAGADVTLIDLKAFPLPLFDQDEEAASGLPENAKKLKALFKAHDGFIISSPEYNSSISPLLKNTIDWLSRKDSPTEPDLESFRGKSASLLSASPGGLGGIRGLVHLRSILGNIGVIVLPDQLSLSSAHEAFDDEGKLKDDRKLKQVSSICKRLTEILAKLA